VKHSPWVPDRGDLIWLNFDPQAGHEQAGHRPALVLSPKTYNSKVGMALLCPITTAVKGYPFEVVLPGNVKVSGAVLADQVRNLDWRARKAKMADKAPPAVVLEVIAKIESLLR
jgi:mRNA interferase MazF